MNVKCDAVNDERYSCNSLECLCLKRENTIFWGTIIYMYAFFRVANWLKIRNF